MTLLESTVVKNSVNQDLTSLPLILQEIYAKRGIQSLSQLDRGLHALLPYNTLSNINTAVLRLFQALQTQEQILIIGDFDTDGATSTAVAVTALREFGATRVNFLVPNRFTYGYGLSPGIVDLAAEQHPNVIITVDNGISSHAGVEAANAAGIDVIITDHHLAGEILPPAYAIINPNQPNDNFASKHIAGVGVIFYLMLALRAYLEQMGWFEMRQLPRPNLAECLDLVALGTVADVVELDQNNRILVHQGICRIRAGHVRPGILALLQVAGRTSHKLQAADLGFAVAPRLNAAGRLDDMSLGINCLLAESIQSALVMAQQLEQLNQERRALEKQMQQEAFAIVSHLDLKQQLPKGVCLYDETWHQGIVGLVASRVKDKVHCPVIAFAKAEEGMLKGSARSIPGIHIRDILALVHSRNPQLINKFGGHAMAAGLSVAMQHYREFTEVFTSVIVECCDSSLFQPQRDHDGMLPASALTLETAMLLAESGPWGQGFAEPIFRGCFFVLKQSIVGERHLKLLLQAENHLPAIAGIAFQVDLSKWPNMNCQRIECYYRLDINEYQNQRKLQLIIDELTPG